MGIRTEAAVIQPLVAIISATLLECDSGGHTRDSDMNYQLKRKGSNMRIQIIWRSAVYFLRVCR